MDEICSEIDMDNISCSQLEVPHSVQMVLKKLDSAQLNRATQEIAEKLKVILNSVNRALFRMQLSSDVRKEEETCKVGARSLSYREERNKCNQMFSTLLQSSQEKENYLSVVLEWLRDMTQDLQEIQDEEFKLSDNITEECVVEMEAKIQMLMSDIITAIKRLQQLCTSLFNKDVTKTVKKKDAIKKDGMWRWWFMANIEKLQPPSAEHILSDITLGAKTAKELSSMLADMAKSLSCSKAMGTGFTFVQAGLLNLNDAFQKQSRQVQKLQTLLKQKEQEWQAALNNTKAELENCKKTVAKLEDTNCKLSEKNAGCLLQINLLQKASKLQTSRTAQSGMESVQFLGHQEPHEITEMGKDHLKSPAIQQPQPGQQEHEAGKVPSDLKNLTEITVQMQMEQTSDNSFQNDFRKIAENKMDQGRFCDDHDRKPMYILKDVSETFPNQTKEHNVPSSTADMEAGKTEKKRQELLFTDQFKKVKHTSQEHTGKVHSDMKNLKEMTAQMQTEQVQQTVDKSCYSFDKESSYDSTLKEEQEVSEEPQLYQKSIKSVTRSSELEKSALTAESTLPSETLPLSGNVEQSKKEKEEEKGVRQIAEKLDQGRVCDDDVRIQMHVLKEAGKMEKSGQELFSTEQVKNTSQQQAGKVHSDLKNLKEITDQIQNEQMEQPFDKWRYSFQKDFRYHMNKETQRTNLLLLQNALQNGQISVALYIKAEELLKNIHNANLKRLAFYLHKYMAFSALWQVRYQLNLKLCSARDHKEGQALKEFYVILTKLDKYEGVLLDRWKARQTAEKQESYFHFARITRMFNQLREAYGLNLLNPYPCQSYSLGKHSLPLITQERQRPVLLEQPNCNHPVKILNFLQTPRNNIAPPQGTREPNALKWSRIPNNVQLDKRLVVTATSVPITTRLQDRNINSSNASALRTVQSREPVRGAVPTVSKCPQTLNIVQLDMKLPVTPTPVPIIPHMLEMNINHSNASALRAVQSRIGESPVLLRRGKL